MKKVRRFESIPTTVRRKFIQIVRLTSDRKKYEHAYNSMKQYKVRALMLLKLIQKKNLKHNIFNLPVNDTNIEFTETISEALVEVSRM